MNIRVSSAPDLRQIVDESTTLSQELKDRFRRVLQPDTLSELDSALLDDVLNRAAVRGYFNLSEVLEDVPLTDRPAVAAELAKVCTADYADHRRKWILDSEARRERLQSLAEEPGTLRRYLSKVPESDALGQQLHWLLQGEVPVLETLNQDRLTTLLLAAQWAHNIADARLEPERVRRQLAHRQLIEPFETLLQHGFFGRDNTLRELRSYVGVLPPQSLRELGERVLQRAMRFRRAKPLSIFGPGGTGKSTLLAKFLHEHATATLSDRFPFAYLDFDRSPLVASEPLSLLLEVIRQLLHQFPEQTDPLESMTLRIREIAKRERWLTDNEGADYAAGHPLYSETALDKCVRALHDVVAPLTSDEKPFVLVLDTFEQVQQRDDADVRGVRRFIQALANERLEWVLRIVIAGRASVRRELPVGTELKVEELESQDAAVQMLKERAPGLSSRDARRIVEHVGRVPLPLKLAGDLARIESTEAVLTLDTGSALDRFLKRLDSERISALLYRRTLTHIEDEQVRRLAYPGLALRKVTPELLERVLAPALHLQLPDAASVRDLFERLAKYVSLVTRSGDTVHHRSDVRQLTLDLMRKDADQRYPEVWLAIHRGAIEYYQSAEHIIDRAEAFYHRLMLEEDMGVLDEHWNDQFAQYLKTALADLAPRSAIYLKAKLALPLTRDEIARLPFNSWADYVWGRAERALHHGSPHQIIALVRDRQEYVLDDQRISYALALALKLTGDFVSAERHFTAAGPLSKRLEVTNQLERGDLSLKLGLESADWAFSLAFEHARVFEDRAGIWAAAAGWCLSLQQRGIERAEFLERRRNLASAANAVMFTAPRKPRLKADVIRNVVLALPVDTKAWLVDYFNAAPLMSFNRHEYEILSIICNDPAQPWSQLQHYLNRGMDQETDAVALAKRELRRLVQQSNDRQLVLLKQFMLIRQPEWRLPLYYNIRECLEAKARLTLTMELTDLLGPEADARRSVLSQIISALDANGLLPQAHDLFGRAAQRGCLAGFAQRAFTYHEAYVRWHQLMSRLANQEFSPYM